MKRLKDWMTNKTWSRRTVAYLFMATFIFTLGYLAGNARQTGFGNGTARADGDTAYASTLWETARARDIKMFNAKVRDCTAAIKTLIDIDDASVHITQRPEWERNVWAQKNVVTSVSVFVKAVDNKPLSAKTIGAIGSFVALVFCITDMKDINIVDVKHSREYDGSGEEVMPVKKCECSCCQ